MDYYICKLNIQALIPRHFSSNILAPYSLTYLKVMLMGNIKSCQQHILFYYSFNKIFLKIVPKQMPLGHWLTFPHI